MVFHTSTLPFIIACNSLFLYWSTWTSYNSPRHPQFFLYAYPSITLKTIANISTTIWQFSRWHYANAKIIYKNVLFPNNGLLILFFAIFSVSLSLTRIEIPHLENVLNEIATKINGDAFIRRETNYLLDIENWQQRKQTWKMEGKMFLPVKSNMWVCLHYVCIYSNCLHAVEEWSRIHSARCVGSDRCHKLCWLKRLVVLYLVEKSLNVVSIQIERLFSN